MEALAFLDEHVNLEAMPPRGAERRLEAMRRLMEIMAEPQRQYPVLHLTGTNGKTTTARVLTALLVAKGLSVGTFTSPHLERVNERLAWNGEPIPDGAFGQVVGDVAALEPMLERRASWFELVAAAAFRWFADVVVDAAVIEVGLGGRYDTTNVADGTVAVVTNVGVDHLEYIGPTELDIAVEKAGIVKPGSTLVLGERDQELAEIFRGAGAAEVWERDREWGCERSRVAHNGRLLDLYTPAARYEEMYLPLHGAHQADNAAAALAAAEAFFGAPVEEDVVAEALSSVRSPGRMEVVGHRPLVILDGAHNPDGARAAAATIEDEFSVVAGRILVVGLLKARDPREMLEALGTEGVRLVVACPPDLARAMPPAEVAAAARDLGLPAEVAPTVAAGVRRGREVAAADDLVLVTGSLYTVGAARTALAAG